MHRNCNISSMYVSSTKREYERAGFSALVLTWIGKNNVQHSMSRLMGKPTICIGENKDADQLRGNREADQRLCLSYSDSTIPLLLKSEISSV